VKRRQRLTEVVSQIRPPSMGQLRARPSVYNAWVQAGYRSPKSETRQQTAMPFQLPGGGYTVIPRAR